MRHAILLAAPFLFLSTSAFAQQPVAAHRQAAPATAPGHNTALPVTHVSLYKNGVGFFEHTGSVTGNASVTIDFTSAQLNDVLQSLTALDLNGGRISGAGYNSTTPLEQQLKTLPLGLGEDPTAADFYAAIRGVRVEVRSGAASITGRLLSMEERAAPPPESSDARVPTQKQFLTVVSETGEVRTLELTPATSVRLLDADLHTDVTRYLQLLAGNHAQGLRHLTLDDRGTGPRQLKVSYISEVPIWKSTYRILFTDAPQSATQSTTPSTATLQGWSVVDNTTGADWINVQLSLIAGSPQSFIQPLSDPIYSRRPEIPIAQEAQLTPQTHDSSNETAVNAAETISVQSLPMNGRSVLPVAKARGYSASAGIMGGMAGGSTGSGPAYNLAAAPPPPPPSYEDAATASLTPQSTAAAFDDFFAYNLTEPITIRKNESALVPILQSKIDADRVTLVAYNAGRTTQPLRALWIKNTSGLTLDRGSFTLIENGAFGGEGLLDPVHPGERRLLSYAADQAVHVSTEGDRNSTRLTLIRGSKGVVNLHRAEVHEVTFVLHNAAADRRSVVTEVPVVSGWTLDSDPQPTETTATVYRFRSEVAPGETVRLHIGGKRNAYTTYYLTRADDNQLTFILNSSNHNPALEQALAPILEARRHVADAQAAVDQTSAKLTALRADEDRQRANITALGNADKGSRDRFVHDLNKTEDAIAAAQAELATRTTALDSAKADLANRIENFQIDVTL